MGLYEIRKVIRDNKDKIWGEAMANNRDPKIYLHWTAGWYENDDGDYHFCINGNGEVHNTHDFDTLVSATYRRNSGSVSIAMNAGVGAVAYKDGTFDLGKCPPTEIQIECMAQMIDVISDELGIPIDLAHVLTHAEAADNLDGIYACEPYGPEHTCERWDLAVTGYNDTWMNGGYTLRGKANFYRGA